MTKIKNTKKGMAKKTLSMSLVVAMLATSNVPVWAAEFSDGTDVAVTSEAEAPAVEDSTADTAEFSDNAVATAEEAPAAEEAEASVPATEDGDINLKNYTVSDDFAIKMSDEGWNHQVTVDGSIKNSEGNEVALDYTWIVDGKRQANAAGAVSTVPTIAKNITYTPDKEDFNKVLSLVVYAKVGNDIVFQKTITGGKVAAQDISNLYKTAPIVKSADAVYSGKEVKLSVTNLTQFAVTADGTKIGADQLTWNYAQKNNDFINATDSTDDSDNITVTGTLEGTYTKGSAAYGYTATTQSVSYDIQKATISAPAQFDIKLNKTSVGFTNKVPTFKKADVTVAVKPDAKKDYSVDITAALKEDANFTGTGSESEVGKSGKANFELKAASFDTTDEAKKILNNFEFNWGVAKKIAVESSNSYNVEMLNLAECTGRVVSDYVIDDFKKKPTVPASDIELTTKDGTTFRANQLGTNVSVKVNQVAIDAAKAGTKGSIDNAVTIEYTADTNNVAGYLNLPIRLTSYSLSALNLKVNNVKLATTAASAPNINVAYTGKPVDIQKAENGITIVMAMEGITTLKSSDYTITYSDNVNAGTVKVTVTGHDGYEGSAKDFYFKINPAVINANTDVTMEKSVSVNSANNNDASLYKDDLKLKLEKTLLTGHAPTTLTDGTDYTVKYYYVKAKDANNGYQSNITTIKNSKGDNKVGDYVFAVVTTKGNYKEATFVKGAKIEGKTFSGVSVSVEKPSYTYTGKEIVPEVTVKDGNTVLQKGVDYSIKVKDNVNAGTATVTVTPLDSNAYNTNTTATATFEITPAKAEDVKVVLGVTSSAVTAGKENAFKYTGRQVKPEITKITLNGEDVSKDFATQYLTYGDNVDAGKEAGSVTVSPKDGNKNFTGTKTQLFAIKGIELEGSLKIYGSDKKEIKTTATPFGLKTPVGKYFYYSGEENTFADAAFYAKDGTLALTEGKDYELKYINNVEAGNGFVAVIAKGNYEGSAEWKDAKGNYISFAEGNGNEYSLKEGKLSVRKENAITGLTSAKELASNVVDIITFDIKSTSFTAKNITVNNGVYAGGTPVKPEVTIKVAGTTLVEGKDYRLDINPIDQDSDFVYPDSLINPTSGKPFRVRIYGMNGYKFDYVDGSNLFTWGIDKKDLKDCNVSVDKDLNAIVINGNVVEKNENFEVKNNGDGTATVSVVDGGKNYTGSVKVEIGSIKVGTPMISDVVVKGNTVTPVLSSEVDGAVGYDYVISTEEDYKNGRVGVSKNILATNTDFHYVQKGTYYAYCHAWKRGADGKKVFGEWSNIYEFTVKATTPSKPSIKSVKVKGHTVTVTFTASKNAKGYDVVLGEAVKKVNGENRPVEYGKLVVKNIEDGVYTATFHNVPDGKYYAGVHSYNKTSEDGKKVFSKWGYKKEATSVGKAK